MMKPYRKISGALVLAIFALIFLTPHLAFASWGGVAPIDLTSIYHGLQNIFFSVATVIVAPIVVIALSLTSLFVYFAGSMLNTVVSLTVVQMAQNLGSTGLGPVIDTTWTAVRDVANMFFIFALLYTAIRTIFGTGDYKRTILNLVIAALLINFSLFFTKVIIDAANYLALVFYQQMVPGVVGTNSPLSTGISDIFTQYLGLPALFKLVNGNTFTNGTLIVQGVMGSVVMLISAFIFLFIAILFVIRYVVLILVMILSPLMFASFILPKGVEGSGYAKKWWDALIGQAFFAPVYFFMTWIVVKIIIGIQAILTNPAIVQGGKVDDWNIQGLPSSGAGVASVGYSADPGAITTIIDFIIIIAFLIASVLIAKSVANKAGSGMSSVTKWAGGFAGGATLGIAGKFGRETVGRYAQSKADDKDLRERAARGDRLARLQLATAEKTARSSFDVRATGIGGALGAGKAQKGGFAADLKAQQKRADDLAKSLGATDAEKEEHKQIVDAMKRAEKDANKTVKETESKARANAGNIIAKIPELDKAEEQLKIKEDRLNGAKRAGMPKDQIDQYQRDFEDAQTEVKKQQVEYEKKKAEYVERATARAKEIAANIKKEKDAIVVAGNAGKQRLTSAAEERKKRIERMNKSFMPSLDKVLFTGNAKREESNYVNALRKAAQGKTKDEQIAELAREKAKEEDEAEKAEKEEETEDTSGGASGGATPKP